MYHGMCHMFQVFGDLIFGSFILKREFGALNLSPVVGNTVCDCIFLCQFWELDPVFVSVECLCSGLAYTCIDIVTITLAHGALDVASVLESSVLPSIVVIVVFVAVEFIDDGV